MKELLFAGQQWIAKTSFVNRDDQEVFREIDLRIRTVRERGKTPLVILDLDGTLYEVRPRSLRIVQEWVDHAESGDHPEVRSKLSGLNMDHFGYSLKELFESLRFQLEHEKTQHAFNALKEFWGARFFTHDYLSADEPYSGSVEWVHEIYKKGAKDVYLTGRDEPGMGHGTREKLIRDGFPWGTEGVHLLLKEAYGLPDKEHKTNAAQWIRKQGEVIASFENEPPNLVALRDVFPEAMHGFVDTACSDHPAPIRKGLYKINGFEEKKNETST